MSQRRWRYNDSKLPERYNDSKSPEPNPALRWPNECQALGIDDKQPEFIDMTFNQFVLGFVSNAYEVQDVDVKNAMLFQFAEIVKVVDSSGWKIGKAVFVAIMHSIEDGRLVWTDTTDILHVRVNTMVAQKKNSQPVVQAKPPQSNRNNRIKRGGATYSCIPFNEGYCRWVRVEDHYNNKTGTIFRHVCSFCEERCWPNEPHPEWQCDRKHGKHRGEQMHQK